MTKVIDVREAVGLVRDGSTVRDRRLGRRARRAAALHRRAGRRCYAEEGRPRDLTTVRIVGIGDFADRGFSQLGLPGLMRRTIGSNIGNEPRLGALVEAERDRGVLVPAGRAVAADARDRGRPAGPGHAGRPGHVRRSAPDRRQAERADDRGPRRGRHPARPRVAALPRLPDRRRGHPGHDRRRGRQPDDGGRGRPGRDAGDGHGRAQQRRHRHRPGPPAGPPRQPAAARREGARARWSTTSSSIPTSGRPTSPATRPTTRARCASRSGPEPPLPLDVRKIIARRSLLEFPPGAICNLGFGISQLIGRVAWEEGITDQLVLTVEQGIFGGVPVAGNEGGAGFNYQAMIDQPYMFDFYDGGGLDVASLSFAEVDAQGNVNVHAFEGRVRGPGGFPNISARTPRINFVGTLTAQGLELEIDGRGADRRARAACPSSCRACARSRSTATSPASAGQQVRYITERAVFALDDDGLVPDRGRAGHRRRARRPGPDGLPAARRRRPADDGPPRSTRRARWAWRPTSGRAGVSDARRARARPGRPPRARQPAAQPRHARARSSSCDDGPRDARRRGADDVRAVVVSGRGERAFSRRLARRRVRGAARARRPGAARAREARRAAARRAADADDRRDRGQRAGRRPGAGAVLRPPDRVGARPARACPRCAWPSRPGSRRHAAAAAGRRPGAGQGADPDRARSSTPTEAERIGLVNEVVPAGRGASRGPTRWPAEIAARGPLAVREAKRLIDARQRARPRGRPGGRAGRVGARLRQRRPARGRARLLRQARPGLPRPMRPARRRGRSSAHERVGRFGVFLPSYIWEGDGPERARGIKAVRADGGGPRVRLAVHHRPPAGGQAVLLGLLPRAAVRARRGGRRRPSASGSAPRS